ncbi:MAG: pilus motility taxis protein HmpF [Stanieria sp.]
MGGSETKLKLLACQHNDQSWSIVPGNELINAEEANSFGEGALIVVNLGTNRQLQGNLESASKRIVSILQGFSRLLEKTKNQEEEIEQWKESLTIQSEELSRREIEMETRLEQLELMEQEYQKLEQQRQEITLLQEEAEKIRIEFETKSQELEGAWAHLRGEKLRLEEQIQQACFIDEEQTVKIQALIDSLSSAILPIDLLQEQLSLAFAAVNHQQEHFDRHWQQLEQHKQSVNQQQIEVGHYEAQLNQIVDEMNSLLASIEEAKTRLEVEQKSLESKQEQIQILSWQQQSQEELQEQISRLGIESGEVDLQQKIDIEALENMPLTKLEEIVNNLQNDLEKVARFVNEQEEELSCQCQTVEELEAKIKSASEFDRLALEQELAEEKEAKRMLDETLFGQRRSMRERHEFLLQHLRVLKRRQGVIDLESGFDSINFEPIKQSLKKQQIQVKEKIQKLQQEIEQIQQNIFQLKQNLEQQNSQYQGKIEEVKNKRADLQQAQIVLAQLQAKLNFYEETLQPEQDILNDIRHKLEVIEELMVNSKDNGNIQNQAIIEMQGMIAGLKVAS